MAEAAGLVLAAVPICVGLVEKYTEVARLLQRFRKYGEEAQYVSQAINIHRSIYRNTIRILLSSAMSEDEAQQMISNPTDPLWSDALIDEKIGDRLGDSRDAFIDAASAVKIKLATLVDFGLECRSLVSPGGHNESKMVKAKENRVRDKIKFAFSEPKIESLITAISRLTQEMLTLIQQTEVLQDRNSISLPSMTTKRNIERYNRVKRAAGDLYKALSRACTVHTEHQARLRLQAVHNNPSQIQFTLAISHSRSNPSPTLFADEPRFWLRVESVISGTLQSSKSLHVLSGAEKLHKRPRDRDATSDLRELVVEEPQKATKTRKLVQSIVAEPHCTRHRTRTEHVDLLPNFCANEKNFCAQLHRLAKLPSTDRSSCVGYLELSGSPRHLVYLKSVTHAVTTTATTTTTTTTTTATPIISPMVALADLFKPEYQAKLPCHGLAPHNRVRIAKQLAMAVLQFQATPWLDKPWSAKEVLMLEIGHDSTAETGVHADAGNDDLFLTVSIRESVVSATRSVAQSPTRGLVRNRLLFDLGVMMLELAFQKPLIELRETQDIDRNDLNTEYHTADRIRRQASARLGPRYAEAARKCIQCDFGSDNDLDQVKLQERFYQNVISELEVLEETFRDFHLSI